MKILVEAFFVFNQDAEEMQITQVLSSTVMMFQSCGNVARRDIVPGHGEVCWGWA